MPVGGMAESIMVNHSIDIRIAILTLQKHILIGVAIKAIYISKAPQGNILT